MPLAGRKPKPEGTKRHYHKPRHEWVEVVDVPYTGPVPPLPKRPGRSEGRQPPTPPRPLAQAGTALWERGWRESGSTPVDVEALLQLCEQADERVALRFRVLRDDVPRERRALRVLDSQIAQGLARLRLNEDRHTPEEWPAETLRWWEVVSSLPHCLLWDDGEWRFALDTALIAARFHAGDLRLASELRRRERWLGTTADARRDLRIRYVDAHDGDEMDADAEATVTAMANYRRMAGERQT